MKNKILSLLIALLFVLFPVTLYGCNVTIVSSSTPTLETLVENNKIEELLDSYNNVTVTTTYDDQVINEYYYEINDEVYKDTIITSDSKAYYETNTSLVTYIVNNDLYELNIYDEYKPVTGFFDLSLNIKSISKAYEEDGYFVLNYWLEEDSNTSSYNGTYYTIWFDIVTLHASKANAISLSTNDKLVTETYEIEFSYDNLESDYTSAYDLHNESSNLVNIEFVFEGKDELIVSTSKNSTIEVTSESKKYGLYLNEKDITVFESLSTYEEDYITLHVLDLKPSISFECDFTNEHVTLIMSLIDEFKKAGLNGDIELYDIAYNEFKYYLDYVLAQETIHQAIYYANPSEETVSAYDFVYNAYYDIDAYKKEVMKELYDSSPIKDHIFKNYSQTELDELEQDNTRISQINKEINDLRTKFELLDSSSPTWQNDVDELYVETVLLYHELALLKGYDNYYDYASNEVYKRYFSEEDRSNLRKYVQEYIIPTHDKMTEYLDYFYSQISIEEYDKYKIYDMGTLTAYPELNEVINSYVKSYENTDLYKNMNAIFKNNAIIFATNPKSLGTAHATWNPIYQQSFVYVSQRYNDMYTLIHEAGHAASFYHYNFYNLCYDIAEIHSQANEWLLTSFLKDNLSEIAFNTLLCSKGRSALSSIISSTFVDEFEETVYKKVAENGTFTVSDLHNIIQEVGEKYLTKSNGFGFANIEFYVRNVTITSPVYYLSYATSQIASLTYFNIAQEEGLEKSQEKYVDLLVNVDSTLSFKNLIKELGLFDPFKEETFKQIEDMFYNENAAFFLGLQDVIFTEVSEIRPLFNLSSSNPLVNFNEEGKVLMIYFTNNASEHEYFNLVGTNFTNLRMVSADEFVVWYKENSEDVTDWNKRLVDLLGFKESASELRFSGIWVDLDDIYRLAYQTDVSKQICKIDLLTDEFGNYPQVDDFIENELLEIRKRNLDFSGSVIYSMLGYTYDLSNDNHHGLSDFILKKSVDVDIEFNFTTAEDLVSWLDSKE